MVTQKIYFHEDPYLECVENVCDLCHQLGLGEVCLLLLLDGLRSVKICKRLYIALFVPDLLIFCVLMLSLVWASFRGPALLLMASLSLSISPAWATISLTVLSSRS